MAAPIISSVVITPQTVNAGSAFKIEVVAEAWELTIADVNELTITEMNQQPLSKLDGGV
ncbi:hypothetical protein [Domibacillus sp.]|uniref:hypothetical protein n=1 Tax=Domibacillus sp. TaxID=1969783 RepID=UPI0028128A8A|nr:hypothetical protein [Domibacillus sp.]